MEQTHYLLLIGCSQTKRSDLDLLPAVERYDGVNFRVIRKAMREGYFHPGISLLIVSAKYGLLEPTIGIEDYDLEMTNARARELEKAVSRDLDIYLKAIDYQQIFINLGKTYRLALKSSSQLVQQSSKIQYATGGIGLKMSQMKAWLKALAD